MRTRPVALTLVGLALASTAHADPLMTRSLSGHCDNQPLIIEIPWPAPNAGDHIWNPSLDCYAALGVFDIPADVWDEWFGSGPFFNGVIVVGPGGVAAWSDAYGYVVYTNLNQEVEQTVDLINAALGLDMQVRLGGAGWDDGWEIEDVEIYGNPVLTTWDP